MESSKNIFPQALTFDDILLLPSYSDFNRGDITLKTRLSRNITLPLPFLSSPMDTVTEWKLAAALAELGGIGFIHRNLSIPSQVAQIKRVKQKKLLVGGAIGASSGVEERVEALVTSGVDVLLIDSAHGYTKQVIDTLRWIKKKYPKAEVIAGSVATADGAKALIEAGADGLRVGMGPGAICTTRIISGMGVPQVTALLETVKIAVSHNIPVIADGGIKYSGDMVKALALGASSVMMGSFFASAKESPGKKVLLDRSHVPHRFLSIFDPKKKTMLFKSYRGMGSVGAMKQGAKVKSEDEFHGKSYYKEKTLVAEGVEGLVPIRGTVEELLAQAIGGIKSGMFYTGARTIEELQKKAKFVQITQASLVESHPHDIIVTNPGENY